jgi:hypothetical protein
MLDGVYVGEIGREVDMASVGVQQKLYTVRAYTASLQGPIGDFPGMQVFEDDDVEREFKSLPELKRMLVERLSRLPNGVAEVYHLWWTKRISQSEFVNRVRDLLA